VSMGWTIVVTLGVVLCWGALLRYRMGPRGLEISIAKLRERLDESDCVILDVRSAREYQSGHIPGALNIPHGRLRARLDELRSHQQEDIIVYCEAGVRARIAQTVLSKAGFAKAYHLVGDMSAWRRAQHPVETGAAL